MKLQGMPTRSASSAGDARPRKKDTQGLTVLRDMNSRRILHLLRQHNPCSCSDLARFSRLSVPTVVNSVARMEQIGLVKNVGKGSSSGGRPPDMLAFNPSYGYVAGVEIGEGIIRVGIADLSGQLLGESVAELGDRTWPLAVVDRIVTMLTSLRESLRIPVKRLLSAGVSAPGITRVDEGIVVSVTAMPSWKSVPLRHLLEEKLGCPVKVENDVNAAALGEHSYGIAQGENNFVFLHIGRGLGAGLFINGKLHHGPQWTAGEIGNLPLQARKSAAGSLEGAICSNAVERQWRETAGSKGVPADLRSVEILDRARQGDRLARKIVEKNSEYLAMTCSYLSLILNCSLIVFGGELGMHPALFDATVARLETHDLARPRLIVAQLGIMAELRGALRLALQVAEAALP
jgi:glucokinase